MAIYSFIAEQWADPTCDWTISEMCRTLAVSRSGYNDWTTRGPSDRELSDRRLAEEIKAIWACSKETYGAPRVFRWLRAQGFRVSRKRVARIMAENGWYGVSGRVGPKTTITDRKAKAASDLVKRAFNPERPDHTWAGDITYIVTGEGWLYLATVIDLYSRRVIGWSLCDHLRTPLVSAALEMAVATRGGWVTDVIFHSDRGCQYTSGEYAQLCASLGVVQSMGATGVCFDNSVAESWFATLKKELVHRTRYATRAQARAEIVTWIEGWYNRRRLHSTLDYMTPIDKEEQYWDTHTDRQAA